MKIKQTLYHSSLILKFKYLLINLDIYTFPAMEEDILRFAGLDWQRRTKEENLGQL